MTHLSPQHQSLRGLAPLLLCAAALLAATPAVAVTPIWSSIESEVIPFDTDYGRTAHVLLEDGSAFLVTAETRRAGLAGTLQLGAGGAVVRGQFGHQPLNGGRLSPEAVLATRGDRVLLAMTELDPPRPLIVLVDSTGQRLWARPRFGRQARFLANGDVLLAAGNELMRLKGADGDLLWVRNLLDLRPNPAAVDFQLPAEVNEAIRLSLQFREFTPAGDPQDPDPLLVSLDSTSGALQWQQPREPATLPVLEGCAPVSVGTDQIHAYFERAATQVDAVIERRRGDTGARLWATRIPAVAYTQEDEPCALVATSSLLAVASRDGVAQSTLFALNAAGALQWRTNLPSSLPVVLRPAADGALLVARQQTLSAGLGTVAERRRASDGSVAWSVEIPGRAVDWRMLGDELHVAWSVDDGAAELHLQRRAAVSGALLAGHVAVAEGQTLRPADIEILDGIPYGLLAGLGADQRGLRLRRLDPDSGTPVWSQTVQLAETPLEVTGASLHPGGSGRLVAVVYYMLDFSPAPPASMQAILSVDAGTGALRWQTALARPKFLGVDAAAQPTATATGSVYVRSSRCTNPPLCDQTQRVVRLSAVDGREVWNVSTQGILFGVRGTDLIVERTGSFSGLAVMGAADGSDLWSQLMPGGSIVLAALATDNNDLHVLRQLNAGGRQRAPLDRRSGANGTASWTIDPGLPTASVRGALVARLADGDLLYNARMTGAPDPAVSRPLLARIDGPTGAIEWLNTPAPQTDRFWTVRPLQGLSGQLQWSRGLRFVGDSVFNVEERYTLTTVNLDSGSIGVEHQYAQTYDPPLPSPALGLGFVSTIRSDRSTLVENRSIGANGLGLPRIERWPAPGAERGDILLRRIGSEQLIRALGPTTEVLIEVEAQTTAAVAGIGIGFASTVDGLKAQLRGCALVAGTGTCPTALGSTLDQTLSLGAGARMQLRYELHDPGFQPRQARPTGARGLFHLDPPFAFGDTDPGNHIAVIQVSLGGMSNGFE